MLEIADRMLIDSIAQRVRKEREDRGWSLADLAARSDVAKGTISKIERQEASPSAAVLGRLAGAFGLTLAHLLLRAETRQSGLRRRGEQVLWQDPETGYFRRYVFSQGDHPSDIAEVTFPPGSSVTFPPETFSNSRQVLLVLQGELVVAEGEARHELYTGDCLALGTPSTVTIENLSTESCVYIVVVAKGWR